MKSKVILFYLIFMILDSLSSIYSQTTVNFAQRTEYYYASFNSGGGSFNNSTDEVGMWANTTSPKQTVLWRKFKTNGDNTGSDRAMQVGDKFTITVAARRAYGRIGVALLASPTSTSSWNDRENNYAISANLDGPLNTGSSYGNWYIKFKDGSTSATTFGGDQDNYYDYKFEFTLTAPDRMNVTISDNRSTPNSYTFYDVELNTSNLITDFSIFLEDDYTGNANANIYWKPNTSMQNTGSISVGSSNTNLTIATVISNGLEANSTSSTSVNTLSKTGSGTLTLTGANTYTGNTTVSSGTLRLNRTGGNTLSTTNNVTIENGGTLQISTAQTLNNLTINTGGSVIVDAGLGLTINGTLTNNGTLTLKSDATGTASLIHSTSGVNATVERYVAGHGNVADAGWHLMGSPVAAFNIENSSFDPGNSDDLYIWSEDSKYWLNYKVNGNFSQIEPGKGYLVAYENNSTKTFEGSLNVSNVSVSDLSYTPNQGNGWHLLGNPFASALKWNDGSWSLNNVAGTAKIWNSTSKSYTDISENGIIPSAQGFFVQVNDATNSLTIPASARVHSDTNWYKASDVPMLKLTARPSDGSSAQETIIRLEPESTLGNDFYWDSRFMAGYAPQLYSSVENTKLSTNALPAVEEEQEIVLGFEKNQHSNFSIELTENTLAGVVYLKDLKLGITHNLSQQPVYTFSSAEGDDPLRFKLSFASVGIGEQQATVPYVWYGNEKLHLQNTQAETVVEVYTVQGQSVLRTKVSGNELSLKVEPGVYMVRIIQPMQENIQKIVVY